SSSNLLNAVGARLDEELASHPTLPTHAVACRGSAMASRPHGGSGPRDGRRWVGAETVVGASPGRSVHRLAGAGRVDRHRAGEAGQPRSVGAVRVSRSALLFSPVTAHGAVAARPGAAGDGRGLLLPLSAC